MSETVYSRQQVHSIMRLFGEFIWLNLVATNQPWNDLDSLIEAAIDEAPYQNTTAWIQEMERGERI